MSRDVRADCLAVGMRYAEYGDDEYATIAAVGMHGDTVLITTDDGMETTLDRDDVVEVLP